MRRTALFRVVLHLSCIWQASALVFERSTNITSSHNGTSSHNSTSSHSGTSSHNSTSTPHGTSSSNSTSKSNGTLVNFAKSAPQNSEPLVSTHISFSIEQDRFPDWTGIDERNQFTFNALVNLQQLTGQPPKIRVGGNSEDHTRFSPTVTVSEDIFPPSSAITPYPEATNITIGFGFHELAKWLPSGTHTIFGINLGLDNVTNAVNIAKSVIQAFNSAEVKAANVHLDFLEVGNEADLYKNNGLRPSNWTVEEYVADWIKIAGPVVQAAGLHAGSGVGIQGAAFADRGFNPPEIFNDGILDSAPGKVIRQISQHHYSGAFCSGGDFALASFMSKAAVRGNLTTFSSDVAAVRSKGFPYVLGETNSIACHGAPGVSNTAGAALWTIDYTLQAATLGMVETYFHEGIGFKYNFIQPISLNRSTTDNTPINPPEPPHVQPGYYSAILVGHATGTTGSASIVELDVPQDNVSGYAIYEQDRLVRAVFVNLDAWLQTSTGQRPSVHLDLGFEGGVPPTASVRRLAIQHAEDVSGLTFAGQTYETSDAKVSGKETVETIRVQDGVDIASTEAILLSF